MTQVLHAFDRALSGGFLSGGDGEISTGYLDDEYVDRDAVDGDHAGHVADKYVPTPTSRH